MELTDEQINQAIHEKVFGGHWHIFEFTESQMCEEHETDFCKSEKLDFNPDYCNDISAAFDIQRKIIELNLQEKYIAALCAGGNNEDEIINRLIFASAKDRAKAALQAIEAEASAGE